MNRTQQVVVVGELVSAYKEGMIGKDAVLVMLEVERMRSYNDSLGNGGLIANVSWLVSRGERT